jgi:hypothetical protein
MPEFYQDWTAVSQAMKSVAQVEFRSGASSHDVGARLVEARLDRFLCRVFAESEPSEWLLKGGSALLARVADARPTKDLDLLASSARDLDDAVRSLVAIGQQDLGDHLRFDLIEQFEGHAVNQREIQLRGLVFWRRTEEPRSDSVACRSTSSWAPRRSERSNSSSRATGFIFPDR